MADLILTMDDASAAGSFDVCTLADLRKEIYDATGKTTLKWQQSVDALINQWIAKLANLHNWKWREKYVLLATVASQDYVDLPSDFLMLLWLRVRATLSEALPTTWDDLVLLRSSNVSAITGGGHLYAVRAGTQASASQPPGFRLEVYPTPADSVADYFAASYRRLLPKLTDAAHVPDIPAVHHPLVRQFIRAEACRYDDDNVKWATERDALAMMLPDHLSIDGQEQASGGLIQGSVRRGFRGDIRPHAGIGFAP